MTTLPYTVDPPDPAAQPLGLIVLSVDETVEAEVRAWTAGHPGALYVTRVPSGDAVTGETLAAIAADLSAAASLLPKARPYPAVGFACTSASALIGSDRIEEIVRSACRAHVVTNPLRALLALLADRGITRLAFLSPYIADVARPLRRALEDGGITIPVHASFGEAEEATVARISTASVVEAAVELGAHPEAEAVFLSCTNLRSLEAIPRIEAKIGKPVFSSNFALAWHMSRLATTEN